MVSDRSKTKKIDARLPEEMHEEISLVAWGCGKKRSELLRMMIADFMDKGILEVEGQIMTWAQCVETAKVKLQEKGLTVNDLQRTRQNDDPILSEQVLSEPLNKELEKYADTYAQKALQAFKRHVEGA